MIDSIKLLESTNITFGTSGARGLANDFTPDVCAAFALSFVSIMEKEFSFDTIVLAIDNRPSSYQMAQAISAGLEQVNIKTFYCGVVPTPALAFFAIQHAMPSIMVTGSHIPFDRNGLKFYRPDGEITKADEVAIINEQIAFRALTNLPILTTHNDAKDLYINRYIEMFSNKPLLGKHIGIYEHSSAGRDVYQAIFESLGAEVVPLGRSDKFVPIDTEAVSEKDKKLAQAWVKEYQLDALFSTDGDGDRPLLSDENGEWLRGDIVGLLCSKLLNIEALSIPVNCNSAVEKCNYFKSVTRTKIGSPYVINEFKSLSRTYRVVAGFEANGGYLLASKAEINGNFIAPLPTRDAVLPVAVILSQLQHSTISQLIATLPNRFTASDRIKNFAKEKSLQLITHISQNPSRWLPKLNLNTSLQTIDKTDGFRMTFADSSIVHLRPSGNAPELRCYAEFTSQIAAEELVKNVLERISNCELNF